VSLNGRAAVNASPAVEAPAHERRICFVVATDVTAKAFLMDHIRALSKEYEVTLVANTSDLEILARAGIDAEVVQVAIERKTSIVRDLCALVRLWMLFLRRRFDAVHSVTPKAGLLSMLAAVCAGVPHRTHTFTGQVWATRSGFSRALLKSFDRVIARCATALLADSHSQRKFLEDHRVAPVGRIGVLGAGSISGVDIERFRPDPSARRSVRTSLNIPEDAIVFVFVGRLNRDKGLLDLAMAFEEHARCCPQSHLLVVGPDEEEVAEQMRSRCAGVGNRLHFVGATPTPQAYMAASDVFCLPSYREGFGTVIIEAAAVGVPAIASRIYGIVDAVVDGQTGLLHPPRDPRALAAAMSRLADDPALRNEFADRCRVRAREEFSSDRITAALVEFYGDVLSGTESTRGTTTVGGGSSSGGRE
jgi:glycosyltransferase involved in cell wall biosynthesis